MKLNKGVDKYIHNQSDLLYVADPVTSTLAVVGAVANFIKKIAANNDNLLIRSRDQLVRKFYEFYPPSVSDPFILDRYKKYGLLPSQIKDRKIFGDYKKEWASLAEFAAELIYLMYPFNSQDALQLYNDSLQQGHLPDAATVIVINYFGPPKPTMKQIASGEINKAIELKAQGRSDEDVKELTGVELPHNPKITAGISIAVGIVIILIVLGTILKR